MRTDRRDWHFRGSVRRAATGAAVFVAVAGASMAWTPGFVSAATGRPTIAAVRAPDFTRAPSPPRADLRANGTVPAPKLPWRSLPSGWTFEHYSDCWRAPALPLGSGGLLVPVVSLAQSTAPLIRQRCAVAVLTRGGWRVIRLAPGESVSAAVPVGPTGFALGTLRESAASLEGAAPPVPGRLLLYDGAGLQARSVALPPGQYVDSLAGLPDGGFAVGTAAAAACRGPCDRCALGRVGVANAGGKVRWSTPPAFHAPNQVDGMAPLDPPCGVVVGPMAGGWLWFGLDGVGVARLDPATGRFSLPAPEQYYPFGYGPIQFLGVARSAVYYAVHRLPGVADAGYWGPLLSVTYGPGGSARQYLPAPRLGCIQGGVGAPAWMAVIGRRLWVRWQDCPIYSAVSGATALGQPAPACRQNWRTSSPGFPVALLSDGAVAEACGTMTDPRFYMLAGSSGRVLAAFGWPRSLAADGVLPADLMELLPAPGGGTWVLTRVNRRGNRTMLVDIGPTGRLGTVSGVPASTAAVLAPGAVWLVTSDAVARLSE